MVRLKISTLLAAIMMSQLDISRLRSLLFLLLVLWLCGCVLVCVVYCVVYERQRHGDAPNRRRLDFAPGR